MKNIVISLICGVCIAFTSCSDKDNPSEQQGENAGVPLIILDTDIGACTDDLFAMEMLYRYMDEGKCKLLGVVVDREGEDCAAVADVMNTYFGYPDLPIGLERNGIKTPFVWIDFRALANYRKEDDMPMFKTSVSDYAALPDGYQLYRKLLSEQSDHSVTICSIGYATSLAHLLESKGDDYSPLSGVELVRRKVKHLYIMGGVFGNSLEPDYNFGQGISFSTTFFSL